MLFSLGDVYPQGSIPLNSVYRVGGGPLEEALSTLDPALLGAITIIWRLDSVSWAWGWGGHQGMCSERT